MAHSVDQFVPGGIKPEDHWHRRTNDGTCSRCRALIPEGDGPLLLWMNDGHDMLAYCEDCLGIEREEYPDDGPTDPWETSGPGSP